MINLLIVFIFLILFSVSVLILSMQHEIYVVNDFYINIVAGLHIFIIESFMVFILIGSVSVKIKNYYEKKRLLDELDLLRGLRGTEARNRVNKTVQYLLKSGKKDLNMQNLDLSGGVPYFMRKNFFSKNYLVVRVEGTEYSNSSFKKAIIFGASLSFSKCSFQGCDFSSSRLNGCDFRCSSFHFCVFKNARIRDCDFTGATGLTAHVFLNAKTLYGSKFSSEIYQEIMLIKPALLTKKPISDYKRNKLKYKKMMKKGSIPKESF